MDEDGLCPICGETRDSDQCCGWCLSCQDDIADWDDDLCQLCHHNSEDPDLGPDAYTYYADAH